MNMYGRRAGEEVLFLKKHISSLTRAPDIDQNLVLLTFWLVLPY